MAEESKSNSKNDYAFGQAAIRENFCTAAQVKECLDIQTRLRSIGVEPKPIAEILQEKGYLKSEQAERVLQQQAKAPPAPQQGRISIPGYEIISKIGQGGMGVVYKARQISMDRPVAIKVLSARFAKDKSFSDRFMREARAVARLNHENVISGIDAGEVGGVRYFVMEYVDGIPLSRIFHREGRLSEERCLDVARQIARALAHAHRHGIVHRDVKPENIMITGDGVAKLCDLGLARRESGEVESTMDGTSVGTPNYISPEQARGENNIDIRTDIYSLGATLYHMSTGTPPFSGDNPMIIMTKHVTTELEPPRERRPELSEGFSNLVVKMMQKLREDRHLNPEVLLAAIENVAQSNTDIRKAVATGGEPVLRHRTARALSPTAQLRAVRSRGTKPHVPILIGAGVLVFIVIVLVLSSMGNGKPPDPGGGSGGNPGGGAGGTKPPPVEPGGGDLAQVLKNVKAFQALTDDEIRGKSPDRFTRPYGTIQARIRDHADRGEFAAEKLWREELVGYKKKVNGLINERIWNEIRDKAMGFHSAGKLNDALKELKGFKEVYRWFQRGEQQVMTEAGVQHQALVARITGELREAYAKAKSAAERAFNDPVKRDEAYGMLDALAVIATSSQQLEIEQTRRRFFRSEVAGILGENPTADLFAKARERLKHLKTLHPAKPRIYNMLDKEIEDLERREQKMVAKAAAQIGGVYTSGFVPKFHAALKGRDLVTARRELHTLCFGASNAPYQSLLLADWPDRDLLEAYLSPDRTAFENGAKLEAMAVQAHKAAQSPVTKELWLDLRTLVLLEGVMEDAVRGAEVVSKDLGRFREGYSDALKDAKSAVRTPGAAGGGVALKVTLSGDPPERVVHLTPRPATEPSLSTGDIAALVKRAPKSGDAFRTLKLFLFYYYEGDLSAAKSRMKELADPDHKLGMERYTKQLAGIVSEEDEKKAEALYNEAIGLLTSSARRSQAEAVKKLRECVESYGRTKYMTEMLPRINKNRYNVAIDTLKRLDPSYVPPK
jgi:serine/threonine-protein kinase